VSPLDIERMNPSMWRGSVHHSVRELGVFVPYRMPIAGLYQTGGSTAPVVGKPPRGP
jgi:phytoene dehydrogenase-like protein